MYIITRMIAKIPPLFTQSLYSHNELKVILLFKAKINVFINLLIQKESVDFSNFSLWDNRARMQTNSAIIYLFSYIIDKNQRIFINTRLPSKKVGFSLLFEAFFRVLTHWVALTISIKNQSLHIYVVCTI